MNIVLEKKDSTFANLKINLQEEDYKSKVDLKIKDHTKKVNIKGFRPGKVPTAVVVKMYGKSILVDEISQLVNQKIGEYIKTNNLAIIGQPIPSEQQDRAIDWENQKDFEFIYDIGLIPEFNLDITGNYPFHTIVIDDSTVNETVENLKKQFGKMVNPDTTAEGDFLYGQIRPEGGDKDTYSAIPLNKVAISALHQFLNVSLGTVLTFDIRKVLDNENASIAYVAGISKEEAEKVSGNYTFTLEKIGRSELAIMDQEFFDKVFGPEAVKSESEFLAKLKSTIEENYSRESTALLKRHIRESLVDNTEIALPKEFLKRWLFVTNEGKVSHDTINSEIDLYIKELKWTLIKNKIALEHNIEVSHEEIIAKTKEAILSQFGNMPLTEQMADYINVMADNYLKEDNGKQYTQVYETRFNEKAFEVILNNISRSEKLVNVEEFKALADAIK